MTSTTETAATIRFALVRSAPDGETYAGIISRDGQLIGITPDLDHEDVQAALEDPGSIAMWDYDEPTEGQVEDWERDGWETGPRLVEFGYERMVTAAARHESAFAKPE